MSYKCDCYKLIEKKAISAGMFSFTIYCPEVAELAKCGQFVHIKVEGCTLRRPISICEIDRDNGTIRIVFEIRGSGTDRLAMLNVGDDVDMIAPLGNGFSTGIADGKRIVVIGGGIGVPPMLQTAKEYEKATAILGFRSYDKIILTEDFVNNGIETIICTDDGSVGTKGTIAVPLKNELEKGDVGAVFACGPKPMLGAIIQLAKEYGVYSEVSLEERMGCGVGACVGCVCKIMRDGEEKMLRVCKDGPVFKGEEVIL